MNKIVKKILTVSTLGVAVVNCNLVDQAAASSAANCTKIVQFIGKASFGVKKQNGQFKKDIDEDEKAQKKIKEKAGQDRYSTVTSPTYGRVFDDLNNSRNGVGLKTGITADVSNVENAKVTINDAKNNKLCEVTISNSLDQNNNVITSQAQYNIAKDTLVTDQPMCTIVNSNVNPPNASQTATLHLQPTVALQGNGNTAIAGYDGLLNKSTNPNWKLYEEKLGDFKTHSGNKWQWFGDLMLGMRINSPMGGFFEIGAFGSLPFNKTIELTEVNNDKSETNQNTDNKNKSTYNLTHKWTWGIAAALGIYLTEKFYVAVNGRVGFNKYKFEPKSSDNSSNTNNDTSSTSTTNNNLISFNDTFDLNRTSGYAGLEVGYDITQNIAVSAEFGYEQGGTLKKANASTSDDKNKIDLPCAVSLGNAFVTKINVGFRF